MRTLGEVIDGRYRLVRKAGAGAMGVVYQAHDLATGAPVAVKVLNPSADTTLEERFRREGEVLARLQAPEIVRYLAQGRTVEGSPYLVTEWLEGESLEERLARGPLSHLETIDVGRQVATALAFAHAQGVVHRDIKPGNVFLVGRIAARVKTLDFGIARIVGSSKLTGTNNFVGTPQWLSPEQANGGEELDGRSDLFSLGSVLYACLTGASPFASKGPAQVLIAVARGEFRSIAEAAPATPPRLAALVSALLEYEASDRPAGAGAVVQELTATREQLAPPLPPAFPMRTERQAIQVEPTLVASPPIASPPTAPQPIAPQPRTSNARILLLAMVPALLVIAAAVGIFFYAQPPKGSAASSSAKASGEATPSSKKSAPEEEIDLGDRSNVDAMVAFGVLEKFLLKKHPGVEVIQFTAQGSAGGKIDLTQSENSLRADNAEGSAVQVSIHGTETIDATAPRPSSGLPLPACSFREIYADAVSHGFASDKPFGMVVTKTPKEVRLLLQTVGGSSVAMLVPGTCKMTKVR